MQPLSNFRKKKTQNKKGKQKSKTAVLHRENRQKSGDFDPQIHRSMSASYKCGSK